MDGVDENRMSEKDYAALAKVPIWKLAETLSMDYRKWGIGALANRMGLERQQVDIILSFRDEIQKQIKHSSSEQSNLSLSALQMYKAGNLIMLEWYCRLPLRGTRMRPVVVRHQLRYMQELLVLTEPKFTPKWLSYFYHASKYVYKAKWPQGPTDLFSIVHSLRNEFPQRLYHRFNCNLALNKHLVSDYPVVPEEVIQPSSNDDGDDDDVEEIPTIVPVIEIDDETDDETEPEPGPPIEKLAKLERNTNKPSKTSIQNVELEAASCSASNEAKVNTSLVEKRSKSLTKLEIKHSSDSTAANSNEAAATSNAPFSIEIRMSISLNDKAALTQTVSEKSKDCAASQLAPVEIERFNSTASESAGDYEGKSIIAQKVYTLEADAEIETLQSTYDTMIKPRDNNPYELVSFDAGKEEAEERLNEGECEENTTPNHNDSLKSETDDEEETVEIYQVIDDCDSETSDTLSVIGVEEDNESDNETTRSKEAIEDENLVSIADNFAEDEEHGRQRKCLTESVEIRDKAIEPIRIEQEVVEEEDEKPSVEELQRCVENQNTLEEFPIVKSACIANERKSLTENVETSDKIMELIKNELEIFEEEDDKSTVEELQRCAENQNTLQEFPIVKFADYAEAREYLDKLKIFAIRNLDRIAWDLIEQLEVVFLES